MSEKILATLEAREGNKFAENGECVGTYNRYHIVFLPKGAKPGQSVRVELFEITDAAGQARTDARGRVMYRARPAVDEITERWETGAASEIVHVRLTENWLGETTHREVLESRPPAERETASWPRKTFKVAWGVSAADSLGVRQETQVYLGERETVQNGSLVWVRTGSERLEPQPEQPDQITTVEGNLPAWFWTDTVRLAAVVPAGTLVRLRVHMADRTVTEVDVPWKDLPSWLRTDLEARCPVCACGRQRVLSPGDGYGRCELCRSAETCDRCGQQARISLVNNQKVCDTCKPLAQQEALVAEHLSAAKRRELADLAKTLLSGQVFEGETGEILYTSTLDHVAGEHARQHLADLAKGYPWYYFCDGGVYGSKFAPAALQLIQNIDRASGNGLVMLAGWVAGDRQRSDDLDWDHYFQSQVVCIRSVAVDISASGLAAAAVAVRLRGGEAERRALVAIVRRVAPQIPGDSPLGQVARQALVSDLQDFTAALAEWQKLEELLAAREAGKLLINFSFYRRRMGASGNGDAWVIRPDGTLREPDVYEPRKRYGDVEGRSTWHVVQVDELALTWNPGTFTVAHRPPRLTAEQIDSVQRIERDDLNCEVGAFGLDEGISAKQREVIAAVVAAVPRCPCCHSPLEPGRVDYLSLTGHGSLGVCVCGGAGASSRRSGEPVEHCDARAAWVVAEVPVPGYGTVKFLSYHKYGMWNLAMRLDSQPPDRTAEPPATADPTAPQCPPPTADALDALRRKFGGPR